jgi:hypothetical protein
MLEIHHGDKSWDTFYLLGSVSLNCIIFQNAILFAFKESMGKLFHEYKWRSYISTNTNVNTFQIYIKKNDHGSSCCYNNSRNTSSCNSKDVALINDNSSYLSIIMSSLHISIHLILTQALENGVIITSIKLMRKLNLRI